MHDMDIDRLAAERHGDGDGLSLLFSGRGEVAEIADVDMHLGALTHVELPAEIEPATGPVGAGQVDHVALIAELPFDPGDHRGDGEIAFDRTCHAAARTVPETVRRGTRLPSHGPVAITWVARAGRRGGDDRGALGQGEVQRGGRGGEGKRQEDGRSRGAKMAAPWLARWIMGRYWPSFHSIVVVFHRFQAQGSVKPLRRRLARVTSTANSYRRPVQRPSRRRPAS
jgi:hypothetical protein